MLRPTTDEHAEHPHNDEVTLSAAAVAHYGVQIAPAQLRTLKPTLLAPARVGFNTEAMAHIGSSLRGRAVEVKVRLGDAVKRGDTLLVIESPELGEAQIDFLQKRIAAQTAAPSLQAAPGSNTAQAETKKPPSAGQVAMHERQKKCAAEWKQAKADGSGLRSLVHAVVQSPLFLSK